MFSLEKFYDILCYNLLDPINMTCYYFSDFGSTNVDDITLKNLNVNQSMLRSALMYDQEPFYISNMEPILNDNLFFETYQSDQSKLKNIATFISLLQRHRPVVYDFPVLLLASSEISKEKDVFLENTSGVQDWYYFFHGFAALSWFDEFKYYPPIVDYTKVFITFNNLFTKTRSYRLTLVASLLDRSLENCGHISLNPDNLARKITAELMDPNTSLSNNAKSIIKQALLPYPPTLTIDTDNIHGNLSAGGEYSDYETLSSGLFHIVTETIFYDSKLHLTEKIFKPIVARRPFILAAAPGNLAYLKGYGFKTFDKWIDESYDLEQDHDKRIAMIVDEIEKLCKLSPEELQTVYTEMREVLEYNFNWFYGGFKKRIVDELVDNFVKCLIKHNAGRSPASANYIDFKNIDFQAVKNRLSM
jgi:hypothetical protein